MSEPSSREIDTGGGPTRRRLNSISIGWGGLVQYTRKQTRNFGRRSVRNLDLERKAGKIQLGTLGIGGGPAAGACVQKNRVKGRASADGSIGFVGDHLTLSRAGDEGSRAVGRKKRLLGHSSKTLGKDMRGRVTGNLFGEPHAA